MTKSCLVALALISGACRLSDVPPDASLGALIDTAIPSAEAGQPGWVYAQRAQADFDADGQVETAVLISDVTLDKRGAPLWEDGHRWQLYIEEPGGERTWVFRQFLPNGKLTADVVRRESGTRSLLIEARTPDRIMVYEVKYSGPEHLLLINNIQRPIEQGTFTGSPRP